jgi:hypothetical protein
MVTEESKFVDGVKKLNTEAEDFQKCKNALVKLIKQFSVTEAMVKGSMFKLD